MEIEICKLLDHSFLDPFLIKASYKIKVAVDNKKIETIVTIDEKGKNYTILQNSNFFSSAEKDKIKKIMTKKIISDKREYKEIIEKKKNNLKILKSNLIINNKTQLKIKNKENTIVNYSKKLNKIFEIEFEIFYLNNYFFEVLYEREINEEMTENLLNKKDIRLYLLF